MPKAAEELNQIRAVLEAWHKSLKGNIEFELCHSGDDLSAFQALSSEEKWEWFRDRFDSPEKVRRYGIRRAAFMTELGENELVAGYFSSAIMDFAAAEGALRLCTHADKEDSFERAKEELSRLGAITRHIPTYAKQDAVKAHWREHIYPNHPKLSNEKAGEWLKDSFPELSVRKLSEYVGQAKKELQNIPSACKT
ncbi:MAG: hypothetical protein HZB47_02505 [Nitrosomonadales bacterium]|nr:hypothetical protein [Nitrosomonadales bacterium]